LLEQFPPRGLMWLLTRLGPPRRNLQDDPGDRRPVLANTYSAPGDKCYHTRTSGMTHHMTYVLGARGRVPSRRLLDREECAARVGVARRPIPVHRFLLSLDLPFSNAAMRNRTISIFSRRPERAPIRMDHTATMNRIPPIATFMKT